MLFVQQALIRHRKWLHGAPPPQPTGRFDATTATAILAFQREAAVLPTADGIVSPRGFTVAQLARETIPPLRHRIFLAMCWAHPNDTLSDADFAAVARDLSCEVAAIHAVADTEAKDSPWDSVGRPVILFERHKFAAHTGGRFNDTYPDISNARLGDYGLPHAQYDRLRRAAVLDEQAALKSASWGLFQILGENHEDAGYGRCDTFVTAMMQSRGNHLRAFVSFVAANPATLRAIQTRDWAGFARSIAASCTRCCTRPRRGSGPIMARAFVHAVAATASLLTAYNVAPDTTAQAQPPARRGSSSASTDDKPLGIRFADGSSVKLVASRRDSKRGLSHAACAITVDRQRIETIGSGDTEVYTCDRLRAAGRLSSVGKARQIGLIYAVSSPNAAFNTALILIDRGGHWMLDAKSVGAYDDTPAARSIAALRLATR